jgi:uncharacterized protein YukE
MDAPEDYNRDRLHKTWGEKHPPSHDQKVAMAKHRRQKQRNRMPGHFGKANWNAYQHYELYNMIMKADPRQMYARAEAWKELSGSIDRTTTQVQQVLEQVMGSWQGQAAVNAGASTTRLMQWAGEASHTAGQVAANMSDYTDAVSNAQRRMPDPAFSTAERRFRDGYTVMTTGGPADAVFLKQLTTDGMVSHQEAHQRKAEAVAVMEEYESHSKNVHDEMPHFTDAGPTTKDQPTWTPTDQPPGGGGAGGGGGTGTGTPGFPGGGAGVGTGPGGNSSTTPSGFVDPSFAGGPGGGAGGPGGLTGFGGGPGSLNGGADGFRSGAGFGAGFPGGAGAGGAAGAAAELGALAGRGPGGVGGVGPGGIVGGAGAGRGAAGGFGGMPVGHGANGEEDGEHTNKYDEGLDLFDDLPPAYPPVFGA